MGIAVLGPLEVEGTASTFGLRDRIVLEALAVRPGVAVSPDSLAEAIWGETPPPSWAKVVQGCVVRLRKALGSDAIETSSRGYCLRVHVDHLDHLRFEDLIGRARELLALGEAERAVYALGEALSLWRGVPFTELAEWGPGRVELERLVELRDDAEDLRIEALLRCGRHREALAPAVRFVHEAPFRERRWGLLALAQYQDGRQRDALDTLHRARTVMVNELGLDPGSDLVSLEQAILRQDPSLVVSVALPAANPVCPYLGLMSYDIRDAGAYFGRDADTAACLERLDATGVLAIVGPSGCGKSSLARAGVAAALERDGRPVQVVVPGPRPNDALAPGGARAVLVVDQCEEAFGSEVTESERAAFFAALAAVAETGRLVLTFRADRLGEISAHPAFAHLVERGLYLLGPMQSDDLRSAIEGPAVQAGLRLEPGLVDLLVREVEGEPGALPLLSHVMRQTWTRREGSILTVAGYRATGGVKGAVSQSAENLFRAVTPRQQGMLRDLMLRLVIYDESGEPVRTRAPRRSMGADEEHKAVIEKLVSARLVSSDGDTVEIAHESLALAWPRLRSWLDDDVEGLRIMRHLSVAANSWDELGRPDSELYRGARQAKAAQWRDQRAPDLAPVEKDFLDASTALVAGEARATEEQVRRERRTNRRLRTGLAAVAAFLAIAIVAGLTAVRAAQREERAATVADARRLGAEALRGNEIDRSLLLAAAATRLDSSQDTRTTLASVLDRAPRLLGAARLGSMLSITMAPDGRTIATGGPLSGVTLFEAAGLEEVRRNYDVPVRRVQFSPDGKHLLAAVNPWTPIGVRRVDPLPLRVLDPRTAALGPTQLGGMPRGRVVHNSFRFSAQGRWLAAAFIHPTQADTESAIRVWDAQDFTRPVASFTVPFIVADVAVSDDGSRLYVTSHGPPEVHAIDVAQHRILKSAPVDQTLLLALTQDGKSLATTQGGEIALLDPEDLSKQGALPEEQGIGGDLAISSAGDRIGYASEGTLVVRAIGDPDVAGERFRTGDQLDPSGIAFAPDGRTAYTTREDGLLLKWDLAGDRQFVRSLPLPSQPAPASDALARVSPDGRTTAYLVAQGESFAVQFLDLETGTWTKHSPLLYTPTYGGGLDWHPASKMVAVVHGDQTARLWDRQGRLAAEAQVPKEHGVTHGVAFSGDGSRVVVGTDKGWVHTFSTSSGTSVGTPLQVLSDVPAPTVGVNHDGSRALSSVGGQVQLLDLDAGAVLRTADVGFQVGGFAWSPDATTVAVSGQVTTVDGTRKVALLDPATMSVRSVASGGQTAGGEFVAYSPDGRRFVTAFEGRASLWDARNFRLLGSLLVENSDGAGFAPDTSDVLIATRDGSVLEWNPDPEAAFDTACQLAGRDLTAEEWTTYLPGRPRTPVCPH